MAKIKIEGQTLDLDDSICKTNQSLKDALLPYYPAVANADIKREEKDGVTTITVTKRAGTKGLDDVVTALQKAPETISPVLLLSEGALHLEMENAILQMLDDERELDRILRALEESQPQAAADTPGGF